MRLNNVGLLGLLVASLISACSTLPRQYPLHDHGVFEITVPADWQDQVEHPSNGPFPTIKFHPKADPSYQVMMAAVWSLDGTVFRNDAPAIKEQIEALAGQFKAQSLDKHIDVHELKGSGGLGYYFSCQPEKPEDYKHVTQGILPMRDGEFLFTILTNDGQETAMAQALEAMRGAVNRR